MLRRLLWLSMTLALVLIASGAHAQRRHGGASADGKPVNAQTIEINLVVGENKTIPASDVASYSLGSPGINAGPMRPTAEKGS